MAGQSVVDVINQLLTDWATPREPTYRRDTNLRIEMRARCSAEKSRGPLVFDDRIPNDLKDFWGTFFSAKLFEDVDYGQSGLRILDYETSNRRTREFNRDRRDYAVRADRVIAEFIGDPDQLLIRCDTSESDFGSIVIALHEDLREEWHTPASSLSSFLEEYASYEGQWYWEPTFKGRRGSSSPPT